MIVPKSGTAKLEIRIPPFPVTTHERITQVNTYQRHFISFHLGYCFVRSYCQSIKMGVRDSHGEATGTPDPVEKGFATLNTIRYVAFYT
jgi:hypothetical protein